MSNLTNTTGCWLIDAPTRGGTLERRVLPLEDRLEPFCPARWLWTHQWHFTHYQGPHKPSKTWFSLAKKLVLVRESLYFFSWFRGPLVGPGETSTLSRWRGVCNDGLVRLLRRRTTGFILREGGRGSVSTAREMQRASQKNSRQATKPRSENRQKPRSLVARHQAPKPPRWRFAPIVSPGEGPSTTSVLGKQISIEGSTPEGWMGRAFKGWTSGDWPGERILRLRSADASPLSLRT